MLSGCAALMLILCAIPIFRAVKRYLKSPSVSVMWFCAFLLFRMLAAIAAEASLIAFVGWIGNVIGVLLWKAADRSAKSEKSEAD